MINDNLIHENKKINTYKYKLILTINKKKKLKKKKKKTKKQQRMLIIYEMKN